MVDESLWEKPQLCSEIPDRVVQEGSVGIDEENQDMGGKEGEDIAMVKRKKLLAWMTARGLEDSH